MDCAVKNACINKYQCTKCHGEPVAKCPICRQLYNVVTQDDKEIIFNTSGHFKVPGFRWVSAFCYGLAKNIHVEISDKATNVTMPEYLYGMIGCRSTLCYLEEKEDITDEERDLRLCALEKALPAWDNLPEIIPKLVVAKHVVCMIKEGLMLKRYIPTDAVSLATLVKYSHCGEDYVNGGVFHTLAIVDYPGGREAGV